MDKENKENQENGRGERRKINEEARKLSQTEKTLLLLEYLRKNTDKDHPVKSIGEIRKAFDTKKLNIGNDKTVNTLIKSIANVCNADMEEHLLPQSEWQIVFDDYTKNYGELQEEPEEKESNTNGMKIQNLYYVPRFSYREIDALTEAVLFSRTLTTEEADKLIKTLEEQFTSIYYRRGSRGICKIHEKICYDRELLRKNLQVIQQAIGDGVQIEYRFNGYSHDKKLVPMGDYSRRVSPYYIVADNGKYYLLAANQKYKNVMILRIDLMTEVKIPERDELAASKGIPRIPVRDISGMPQSWNADFPLRHLSMSYDPPVRIKLRIKKDGVGYYTFLHDHFGDSYTYRGVDKQDANYDIVEVQCSPFGMVNLALQFADRMEVLEPSEVREEVQRKARILYEKYQDL